MMETVEKVNPSIDTNSTSTDVEQQDMQGDSPVLEKKKSIRVYKWMLYCYAAAAVCILILVFAILWQVLRGEDSVSKAKIKPSNSSSASRQESYGTSDPMTLDPKFIDTQSTFAPTFPPTRAVPSFSPRPSPDTNSGPSKVPTASPTAAPTGIDPNAAFKIRLFWQQGYYWQENWDEKWFCIECTKCQEYGYLDGWVHGCKKYQPNEEGFVDQCEINDQFWTMQCRDRSTYFNVLSVGSAHQVRVNGTNLCMERGAVQPTSGLAEEGWGQEYAGQYMPRVLRARTCDATRDQQLFAPFPSLSRFEMRPYEHRDLNEREAECVSQLHHPKDTEVLSFQECRLDRIYETNYWEQYVEGSQPEWYNGT